MLYRGLVKTEEVMEMGLFLNPDNRAFQTAIDSEIYVDKTGLIEFTNKVLGTQQAFICNSRPRRQDFIADGISLEEVQCYRQNHVISYCEAGVEQD